MDKTLTEEQKNSARAMVRDLLYNQRSEGESISGDGDGDVREESSGGGDGLREESSRGGDSGYESGFGGGSGSGGGSSGGGDHLRWKKELR